MFLYDSALQCLTAHYNAKHRILDGLIFLTCVEKMLVLNITKDNKEQSMPMPKISIKTVLSYKVFFMIAEFQKNVQKNENAEKIAV